MPKLTIFVHLDHIQITERAGRFRCDADDAQAFVRYIGKQILRANTGPNHDQGYFALGQLVDLAEIDGATFASIDDISAFPETVEQQTFDGIEGRLTEISDKDFDKVIAAATGFSEEESNQRQFVTQDRFTAELAPLYKNRCSFSDVETNRGMAFIIRPIDQGGSWHISNFVFLDPELGELFASLAWSVGAGLQIIIDANALSADIAGTVNRTGRLILPQDSKNYPDRASLAWHLGQFTTRLTAGSN